MILVGLFDSPFVRRVAVAMNHYGMPFERQTLSVFTDFDKMLAVNPLGKVPVLELEEGEYLFDSRIILDYLEDLAPAKRSLMPAQPAERRQALRVEAVALGLAEKSYERGVEFARRDPEKFDPKWATRLKTQIVSALRWLEALKPDPWLCGEKLTRADITLATAYTFLRKKQQIKLEPGEYPTLDSHCDGCEALAAFKASPYSATEAAQSGWKPRQR